MLYRRRDEKQAFPLFPIQKANKKVDHAKGGKMGLGRNNKR